MAGATVGKQGIYAIVKPLSLYSNNVPYEDTNWYLCGLVTEKSIYGLGNSVYKIILAAIVGSTILAAFCVYFLVTYVTKPVNRLVEGVRGGVEGIHAFAPADIAKIDELHDVIENLTDAQQQAEERLLEGKERYRIAVETSEDIFFTFWKKEKKLHIRKLKKTEPFEKLKQMSLPSLALNLFDRSGEMKVSMDMLSLKTQEIYHMENLIITRFYRDTLVNLYGYSWKEKDNSWDGILRCKGSDYKRYVETKIVQKLMPVTKKEQNDVTIC